MKTLQEYILEAKEETFTQNRVDKRAKLLNHLEKEYGLSPFKLASLHSFLRENTIANDTIKLAMEPWNIDRRYIKSGSKRGEYVVTIANDEEFDKIGVNVKVKEKSEAAKKAAEDKIKTQQEYEAKLEEILGNYEEGSEDYEKVVKMCSHVMIAYGITKKGIKALDINYERMKEHNMDPNLLVNI